MAAAYLLQLDTMPAWVGPGAVMTVLVSTQVPMQ